MSLEPITDYVRRGILSLPPSYWGKPRIASALRALLEQVQFVEDETQKIITARTVDGAWLHQLRVLGDIVGQPDTGLSVEDYRKAIKARAIANKSRGGVDTLLAVWEVFSAAGMAWEDLPPAKMRLTAESVGTLQMATIFELLRVAKGGGIGLEMLWAPGVGMRFSSSTGGSFGVGEMSSVDRDLGTILGQTPSSQLSGFDLPVGPGASWTWTAAAGASFDTTTATIGSGWFGLPTALAVQGNLFQTSLAVAHVGQINLPWAVAAAVKIDSTPTVSPSFSAFWSVSSSASASGYKCFGFDLATGLTGYRVNNDANATFQVNGAAMPLDIEVVVGQFFDGTNITVLALDPLSGNISELIPATAVGASGAIAAANNARLGGVDRIGTDLLTDMDIRAALWVNSPTFGIEELKDAMRHLCQPPATSLPGVGGLFSINPRV